MISARTLNAHHEAIGREAFEEQRRQSLSDYYQIQSSRILTAAEVLALETEENARRWAATRREQHRFCWLLLVWALSLLALVLTIGGVL
jgi:hypothetical protein